MHRTAFTELINNLLAVFGHRCAVNCVALIAIVLSVCFLPACTQNKQQHDYSIFTFGTLIDVTLYDVDKRLADTAFQQLEQAFDEYHQNWSPWTNGDLAKLNQQLGQSTEKTTIEVPAHLVPIIKTSISLSQQSDNLFNPAIGKLINLWQFHKYQEKGIHPPDKDLILTLIKSNPQMSDLSFDQQHRLQTKNPAVLLSFGAFAKGYAIKLAMQQLKQLGIHNAIINAGGDLSVIGRHGNRAWSIGIHHPRKESLLASIEVNDNESIFTSGDYERFYFYQNTRYHHILDSRTGYPSTDAQSVTVLHHDAGVADAAATALFIAGGKNWQKIAKNMAIDFVMLIDGNGNIELTPAMQKRIKFLEKPPASLFISDKEL